MLKQASSFKLNDAKRTVNFDQGVESGYNDREWDNTRAAAFTNNLLALFKNPTDKSATIESYTKFVVDEF